MIIFLSIFNMYIKKKIKKENKNKKNYYFNDFNLNVFL